MVFVLMAGTLVEAKLLVIGLSMTERVEPTPTLTLLRLTPLSSPEPVTPAALIPEPSKLACTTWDMLFL